MRVLYIHTVHRQATLAVGCNTSFKHFTVGCVCRKDDTSLLDMKKVEVGKDAAMEAEVKAARERAVVPVEIRMKQFRDMLAEKEVFYSSRNTLLLGLMN